MKSTLKHALYSAVLVSFVGASAAQAQTLGADFAASYTATDLGSVPDLPPSYGGLTFLNNNTLLIGGTANDAAGLLYSVGVTRDASNQITGFSGPATQFGTSIGAYNDGGVVFGPDGVLFTSRWPVNELGQTKPGSLVEDKIIDLAALGIAGSHAAINFVPGTFSGAGNVKLVSFGGGEWYNATLSPDGAGTFDLVGLTQIDLNGAEDGNGGLPGGPEGFTFVSAGNPGFTVNSLLVSDWLVGSVSAYEVDANGDPILGTRRSFVDGLDGAEGAVLDPLTGDFLFSTFGGGDRILLVSGFTELPPPPVPEPETYAMLLAGLSFLGFAARRRKLVESALT